MPKNEVDDRRERRSGAVTLAHRRWEWEAVHAPPEGEEADNSFLRWFELTFRLEEDPEQEAFARVGISPGDWSEETLRQILRSARTRTWRGPGGRLWTVRLEGWSGQGISTEISEAEGDGRPTVIFTEEEDGEEVRRSGAEVESITAAAEGELTALLEGGD